MFEVNLQTGSIVNPNLFNIFGASIGEGRALNSNSGKSLRASLNGKNLLETNPIIETVGPFTETYNTGDIYVQQATALSTNGSFEPEGNFIYNVIDKGNAIYFSSTSHSTMANGFSSAVGSNGHYYEYYLNGVKLQSGQSYTINLSNEFVWSDSNTSVTGMLHGTRKISHFVENTGQYDIFGVNFVRGTSMSYLNGLRQNPNLNLEINSGLINKINSGLQSSISATTGDISFSL